MVIVCRQCGTSNPDDARYCASCGAPLHDSDSGEPTIIDISDGGSEIYVETDTRDKTFSDSYIGSARVYVSQSGNRGCLIIIVVALLAICCVCVGWWAVADSIFF